MGLLEEIKRYIPFDEQEIKDKEMMLQFLASSEDVWTRENRVAHMTSSAWVTNREHDKILMAYHNIYQSWAWLGGHADGEHDLLKTAVKEAMEESGIRTVKPVTEDLFSLEVLMVPGHVKRGEYVSSHLHLNVTYLLEADEKERVRVKKDENSGVKWFSLEDSIKVSSEAWMREWIYKKLVEKMKFMKY